MYEPRVRTHAYTVTGQRALDHPCIHCQGNGPIYRGIRNGFNNAYDTCEPTAYRTNELIEACRAREQASRDNVKAGREPASALELLGLDTCQKMDPDRVYMYCGGFAPWTVADTGSQTLTLSLSLSLSLRKA